MTKTKKYFATLLFKFDGRNIFRNFIFTFENNKVTLEAITKYIKEYREDYGADEVTFIGMIPLDD